MMNVLKPFLIVFLSMAVISCSKDDESNGPPSPAEKIIGLWQFHEITIDGEVFDPGACSAQSTVEFRANGVFVSNSFSENFNGGGCEEETITGQWEYIGNNIFETTLDGVTESDKIVFSENGTVFGITSENADGTIDVATFVKID